MFLSCSDLFSYTFNKTLKTLNQNKNFSSVLPNINESVLQNRAKKHLINVQSSHDCYFFCYFWSIQANIEQSAVWRPFLLYAHAVFNNRTQWLIVQSTPWQKHPVKSYDYRDWKWEWEPFN